MMGIRFSKDLQEDAGWGETEISGMQDVKVRASENTGHIISGRSMAYVPVWTDSTPSVYWKRHQALRRAEIFCDRFTIVKEKGSKMRTETRTQRTPGSQGDGLHWTRLPPSGGYRQDSAGIWDSGCSFVKEWVRMGKTGKAENGGKPRHRAQPQRKLAYRQKRSEVSAVWELMGGRKDWAFPLTGLLKARWSPAALVESRVTIRPGPQHPLKPPQPEPKTQTERAPAAFPSSTQRALLHEVG